MIKALGERNWILIIAEGSRIAMRKETKKGTFLPSHWRPFNTKKKKVKETWNQGWNAVRQYVGCIIKWQVEIRATDIEDYLRDVPFYELDQMYRMSLSSRPRPPRLLMHSTIYAEHFYLSSRTSFTLLLRRNKFLLLAWPIALRLSDVNRWRSSSWYAEQSCTNELVTNGIHLQIIRINTFFWKI